MMLNTTNNKIEIKTPATGIIQRSADKSFFLRFHQNSTLSKELLEPNPLYNGNEVSILQMMLINEGYILAEVVKNEDLTETLKKE